MTLILSKALNDNVEGLTIFKMGLKNQVTKRWGRCKGKRCCKKETIQRQIMMGGLAPILDSDKTDGHSKRQYLHDDVIMEDVALDWKKSKMAEGGDLDFFVLEAEVG